MDLGVCRIGYTSGWVLEIDLYSSMAQVCKWMGKKELLPKHSVLSTPFWRGSGIKKTNASVW